MEATPRKSADDISNEVTENCLLTRTRQISRVLTALYDQEMRSHGVLSSQFTLLVLIHELGPISRADLGRKNHQDRSTLTRNLQPLLTQGWVREEPAGMGGRRRPLQITRQGQVLVRKAAPGWSAAQAKARLLLGAAGVSALMGIAAELPRRTL